MFSVELRIFSVGMSVQIHFKVSPGDLRSPQKIARKDTVETRRIRYKYFLAIGFGDEDGIRYEPTEDDLSEISPTGPDGTHQDLE